MAGDSFASVQNCGVGYDRCVCLCVAVAVGVDVDVGVVVGVIFCLLSFLLLFSASLLFLADGKDSAASLFRADISLSLFCRQS